MASTGSGFVGRARTCGWGGDAAAPLVFASARLPGLAGDSARTGAASSGRGWLNTGGKELTLADLRGKIVLLDFWTFCCINCLHVLDELRPLEEKYGDVLVVIGVHSPKFEHERDPEALRRRRRAVRRRTTRCSTTPTDHLAAVRGQGLADADRDRPRGLRRRVDGRRGPRRRAGPADRRADRHPRGEGHAAPRRRPVRAAAPSRTPLLRFPGKAIELPDGNLLVSDSARHSLVELDADGETVVRRIGTGTRGRADGVPDAAEFSEPQGLCLLPPQVAEVAGYDVVVADTVNHLLRGRQARHRRGRHGRRHRPAVALHRRTTTPHDALADRPVLAVGRGLVRRPGHRRDGRHPPAVVVRPGQAHRRRLRRHHRRGAARRPAARRVDGAAVRAVASRRRRAGCGSPTARPARCAAIEDGELHTAVGQGLFDFGHVDGPADQALLQHPLGVCALPTARCWSPTPTTVRSAGSTRRPTPCPRSPTGWPSRATSCVTAGRRRARGRVGRAPADRGWRPARSPRPVDAPASGTAPSARRRCSRRARSPSTSSSRRRRARSWTSTFGPSTRLEVSASPPELLLEGAGVTTDLSPPAGAQPGDVAGGVLQVVAQAATCDADVEHAACHLTRQDWGVPIVVAADGAHAARRWSCAASTTAS